jgi:hypothetical protein
MFDIAHTLPGRSTAVPGWFHGTDCVAILDARAHSRLGWSSDVAGSWQDDESQDELRKLDPESAHLLFASSRSGMATVPGCPRAWIIDARDAAIAGDLAAHARSLLVDPLSTFSRTESDLLGPLSVDLDALRPVERVYERRVGLGRPESAARMDGENIVTHMDRLREPQYGAIVVGIPAGAAGVAGIKAMQSALRAQVLEVAEEQTAWLNL